MDFATLTRSIGNKYYRYLNEDPDSLEVIRIIGIINSDTVKIQYEKSSDVSLINACDKIQMVNILSDYRSLLSDGFISFNIVETVTAEAADRCIDDVMVMFWKRTSGKVAGDPDIICRQNINDFFYAYMAKNEDDVYSGVSVTKDDCPAEIDFKQLLACSKLNFSTIINIYLDDKFEDILKLIKTNKFDHILEANLMDHIKCLGKQNNCQIKLKTGTKSVNGFCIDLETLLKENEFWYDMYITLGITPLNIKLKIENETMTDPDQVQMLRYLFKANINKTFVLKYDKDIDMSKIKSKYILVRDTDGLYIIGYTEDGDYIEPDTSVREIETQMQEALNNIACRFSTKYN